MADLTNARFETLSAREAAVANGICADCKTRPRTVNKDGSEGRRCDFCKQKTVNRPALHNRKPVQVSPDWECPDWIDRPEYIAYCAEVWEAVKNGAETIADQKRAMGETFQVGWHMDALGSLEIVRSIRQTRFVSPLKWSVG